MNSPNIIHRALMMTVMMLLLSGLVYFMLGEQTLNLQKTVDGNGVTQKIGKDSRNHPAGQSPQRAEENPQL